MVGIERAAPQRASFNFDGRLVIIVGAQRHGKNTTADIIQKHRPRTAQIAFADKLKAFVKDVYDFSDEQVYGARKDEPDERYPRFYDEHIVNGGEKCARCGRDVKSPNCIDYMTPREPQRTVGNDIGRGCYPRTWIDDTFRRAARLLEGVRVQPKRTNHGADGWVLDRTNLVVVTDGRYVNEAQAGAEANGRILRVRDPRRPIPGDHPSEVEQYSPAMDAFVRPEYDFLNDGTIEDLERKVLAVL